MRRIDEPQHQDEEKMNHITNAPYDQPDKHTVEYNHMWTEEETPSRFTRKTLKGTVTFNQQEGMPTPWNHWEDALYFILSIFPLNQLTTEATLQYRVRDDLTIVDPHPPADAAEDEDEYQITTNTSFSLSMNQQNGKPDEPLVITGTGTIYAEKNPEVALGTTRARIEIEQKDK